MIAAVSRASYRLVMDTTMMRLLSAPLLCAALLAGLAVPDRQAMAQPAVAAETAPTYADLATLADTAPLVVRVRVRDQAVVPEERAPGVATDRVRMYVEGETLALLRGGTALPQALRFLIDLPRDAKGRAPKLKKREFLLFARSVAGRPGELQLVGLDAFLPYSPAVETRLRPILAALAAADAPPRVTGVRDAASSAGALAGESETQVFLATQSGAPAALTIVRRPGMAARWGVSWNELVDQSAVPPAPDSLAWYRLACALPAALPPAAVGSGDDADRARALEDYRLVVAQLGPCARSVTHTPR